MPLLLLWLSATKLLCVRSPDWAVGLDKELKLLHQQNVLAVSNFEQNDGSKESSSRYEGMQLYDLQNGRMSQYQLLLCTAGTKAPSFGRTR